MQTNVVPIVTACREMSETKTGALIVIGQQSDLRLIAEGGIALDAKVSTSLLKNIFFKNAPLHDGAVLIEGDRIVAAKCILPVTQSDVPKSYGTRHRAAIGMSEISDAIIIVVSEETGGISIAHGRGAPPQHRPRAPATDPATLPERSTPASARKKRWPSKAGAGEKQQGLKNSGKAGGRYTNPVGLPGQYPASDDKARLRRPNNGR